MLELREALLKQFFYDANPRYPSGSLGWERFLIDQIAELRKVAQLAEVWVLRGDSCPVGPRTKLEQALRSAGYLGGLDG